MSQEYADLFQSLAVTATPFTAETPVLEKPNWATQINVIFEITDRAVTLALTLEIEQIGPGAAAQSLITSSSQTADGVDKIGVGGQIDRTTAYDAFSIAGAPAQWKLKLANSGTGTCTLSARVEYLP